MYLLKTFFDGKVRIGRVSFELIRSGQDVSELVEIGGYLLCYVLRQYLLPRKN